MHRTPLALASVLAAVGLLLAGAGAASAAAGSTTGPVTEPTPNPDGSVTVTVPPETVDRICTELVPRARERLTAVAARVDGDAQTAGSVASLDRRADAAAAAGDDTRAENLRERSARRADRTGQIDRSLAALDRIEARFCAAAPAPGS